MLSINIDQVELFNEQTNEFFYLKPIVLKLEHSLISISKWEAKWHKPFADSQKTDAEMRDYIRCMTLNGDLHPAYYSKLSREDIIEIENYINDEMTATTFHIYGQQKSRVPSKKRITSELIYYWMITLNIPFECEKWHLNRLLTLIRVCNVENSPKKMSKKDIYAYNRAVNAANRKKFNSKG